MKRGARPQAASVATLPPSRAGASAGRRRSDARRVSGGGAARRRARQAAAAAASEVNAADRAPSATPPPPWWRRWRRRCCLRRPSPTPASAPPHLSERASNAIRFDFIFTRPWGREIRGTPNGIYGFDMESTCASHACISMWRPAACVLTCLATAAAAAMTWRRPRRDDGAAATAPPTHAGEAARARRSAWVDWQPATSARRSSATR